MTDHKSSIDALKQQIMNAVDFNKLIQDNEFLTKLKNLSNTDQLKIFEEYKEKFLAHGTNSQSIISKWITDLTNTDVMKQNLDDGLQQGQKLIENIRNSLK